MLDSSSMPKCAQTSFARLLEYKIRYKEEEIKIMHELPVDHGPGHLHVKYLPDAIIEILHIFHPDPFDAAYKHHLLDHLR